MASASTTTRTAIEIDPGEKVKRAQGLQTALDCANLDLVKRVSDFQKRSKGGDEDGDENMDKDLVDDDEARDPAIVAFELDAQVAYLQKLKFQYLEQNAKDKYVKSIVSDIDDAPIVTADDNRQLAAVNEEKKRKLKAAKERLAEVQGNIRRLAPSVEDDYQKVRAATEKATLLSQKIIQARTALMLLRQTHPEPRLTIPLAHAKLAEQVDEMRSLSDQVQETKTKGKAEKDSIKSLTNEVEGMQTEAEEVEKAVRASQVEEEDDRLTALYDWYSTSLTLHRSLANLEDSRSVAENELQLTYRLDDPSGRNPRETHRVTINLIFTSDTRQLAAATVTGFAELGIETDEVVYAHTQSNDPQGMIAALLARARTRITELNEEADEE